MAVERGLLPAVELVGRPQATWAIEKRMARYHVPGLSVAVIREGKIDWARGYGVTLAGTQHAVSDSTLFQAASISKPVVALGVLQLVERNRLDLDADVNRRLRLWKVPASEFTAKQPVTLRELLSHTAGIATHGFSGYPSGKPLPTLIQILDGDGPANSPPIRVESIPGSEIRYSGGGYEILQQFVEEATQQSFADFMGTTVLQPLAMNRSTFAQPLTKSTASRAASGHRFDGSAIAGGWNTYPELAAAGLWSTPTDLALFCIQLSDAFRGQSDAVPTSQSVRLMLTSRKGEMGLGLGVHGEGERIYFDHAGWNAGFRAYMAMYPRTGNGVVIMANGDGGNELIEEVVKSVARVYRWPDFAAVKRAGARISKSVLRAHSGSFHVGDADFDLTITREDDHLVVITPRGSRYTFYPATENEYFAIEDGSTLSFAPSPDGTANTLNVWGMQARRVSGH